jgi:DNA-binding GntR family transcriptional regulator
MSTEVIPGAVPPPGPVVSRRERVYLTIRAELMSGRVSPFERLTEERLAERHGVSRTPVREALARLQADGIVVKRDSGLHLYVPSFHELTDLYELRITLELRGLTRALEDPTVHHDRARLEAELDRWYGFRDDRPAPDAGFVAQDERFHATLLDTSGNPALTSALDQANRRIRSVRMYDYLTEDRMAATITEHIGIAELVVRDRLPQALEALRAHVGASREVVMERAAAALAMTRMMASEEQR